MGNAFFNSLIVSVPSTVIPILIAAFAASRGSDRLHRYLVTHPRFGPSILDWQAHGAVSRRAKWAATLTMLLSAVVLLAVMLSVASHRWWMAAIPIACMAIVAAWLKLLQP